MIAVYFSYFIKKYTITCVATVMMPIYIVFTLVPIVLLGIGIAKIAKIKNNEILED